MEWPHQRAQRAISLEAIDPDGINNISTRIFNMSDDHSEGWEGRQSEHLNGVPPDGMPETIPRLLWTFWDSVDPPTTIAACFSRMAQMNVAWNTSAVRPCWNFTQLHFGHDLILSGLLQPPPVDTMSIQHAADWYKLVALARYGGVWLDPSSVVLSPLEDYLGGWVNMTSDALVQGFSGPQGFSMENWAFALPAHSPFAVAWLDEYRSALVRGPEVYLADPQVQQYLTMHGDTQTRVGHLQHACWAVVRSRDFSDGHVEVQRADAFGDPLFLQAGCHWDGCCVINRLFSETPEYFAAFTFVRLRSEDRACMMELSDYAGRGSWLAADLLAAIPPLLYLADGAEPTIEQPKVPRFWLLFGILGLMLGGLLILAVFSWVLWYICLADPEEVKAPDEAVARSRGTTRAIRAGRKKAAAGGHPERSLSPSDHR